LESFYALSKNSGQKHPLLKINDYLCPLNSVLMFSKACEYGIRAAICVAEHSLLGKKVSLKGVATAIESPEAYTSKILQQLVRFGIINSDKGPTGGFSMDEKELENVKLSTIVLAIDGNGIYTKCGLGLKSCSDKKPCPVHNQFKLIRDNLRNMLETSTIKSLAVKTEKGVFFLKH
jgi:Rrf2 family iron-sulfur cluster assembly transcriptional regulator